MNSQFNIKDINFTHREQPKYNKETITMEFTSESSLNYYIETVINKHGAWSWNSTKHSKKNYENDQFASTARYFLCTKYYRCDHAGSYKKKGRLLSMGIS